MAILAPETVDKRWFLDQFAALPEETDRAFEKATVELALCAPKDALEPILEDIIATEEDGPAYAAYCTLHTCYRRLHDHTHLVRLEKSQAGRFAHHPSALHMELLAFVDMGESISGEHVLRKALLSTRQMPENAGALHLFADLTALYYEAHPEYLSGPAGEEAQRHRHWLTQAVEAVDQSIAIDDYAKFYYTRARLLSLEGQHDAALRSLQQAIDKEDSSRADYAIRMATYLSCKMQLESIKRESQLRQSLDGYRQELSQKQQQAEEQIGKQLDSLNSSTVKNLEFLGLFAGIVSFTIGGVNIASNAAAFSFQGAAGLLVVLLGALLEVFCGFGIILHGWRRDKASRNIVVLVFGLLMIVLGLVLCVGQ